MIMLNKEKAFLYFDRAIVTCLCLLIFCLPFTKAGAETFTWIAITLWILKRVLGYRSETLWGLLPKTGLNKALGIFIAVNILSVVFSASQGLSLRAFFGKELKFLAIYFMIVEVINNKKRLKSILLTIIASVVLISIDAGVQYFTKIDFLRGNHFGETSFCASFYSATGFAAWLIIMIPLLIGIIAVNIFANKKLKIFLFILVIVQLLYLLKTYSRGAWLGFIIAAIVMVYFTKNNISLRIKILFLSLAVCLLATYLFLLHSLSVTAKEDIQAKFKFSQPISQRIKSIPQINQGSNLVRVMLWKESLRITRDYPFVGCGLNTYSIVARNYKSFAEGGIYPHNSYLQMAAETGLLGLLAFLWLLFTFFKTGMRHLKQRRNTLALGLLSGILAFLVHAFFDTHFYSLQLVVLFWYMLGLTIAVINLEPK